MQIVMSRIVLFCVAFSPSLVSSEVLFDGKAAADLAERIKKAELAEKWNASGAIARLGPVALSELRPLFSNEDKSVREAAARAVELMGPAAHPAVKDMIALLDDPDADVREKAADALEAIGEGAKPAIDALINRLGDSEEGVVDSAISALGSIGPAAAPKLLLLIKNNKDKRSRVTAIRAIALIRPTQREIVTEIVRLLRHPDQDIRKAAMDGTCRLGPAAALAVPSLIYNLQTETKLRWLAAAALGSIGAEAAGALPSLKRAVKSGDTNLRICCTSAIASIERNASNMISNLIEQLDDTNAVVRRMAIQGLSGSPSEEVKRAIPALERALNDPNEDNRKAAFDAILRITGKEPITANGRTVPAVDKTVDEIEEE